MTWWQFIIVAVLVPLSVEVSIRLRWHAIQSMFDRALMHGGSLDTLGKALKSSSEESRVKADQALNAVGLHTDALELMHQRVRALEEHPLLRRPGGGIP